MRFYLIMFIICANIADALCTDYGIRLGLIVEANPMMGWVYRQSEICFLLLKLTLPILLLIIVPKKVSTPIKRLLYTTCGLYLFVLSVHSMWLFEHFKPI